MSKLSVPLVLALPLVGMESVTAIVTVTVTVAEGARIPIPTGAVDPTLIHPALAVETEAVEAVAKASSALPRLLRPR